MTNCKTLASFLNGSDIWGEIKKIENFPFLADDNSTTELNMMLIINYGQRVMFSAFNNFKASDVANQIVRLYSSKWTKLISFDELDYNIGAESIHNNSGNETSNTDKDDDSDTTNTTAAYNSDELLADTGAKFSSREHVKSEINRESKQEVIKLKTAFDNLSLVDKTNIINIVLKDVANYLTVSVY